jgi:hypothetical protein
MMGARKPSFWTTERDDLLESLWGESDISTDEIARRIGCSRDKADERAKSYLGLGPRTVKVPHVPSTEAKQTPDAIVSQDQRFQAAMMTAIEAGTERAPIGVCEEPGTKKPRLMEATSPIGSGLGSPTAMCADQ